MNQSLNRQGAIIHTANNHKLRFVTVSGVNLAFAVSAIDGSNSEQLIQEGVGKKIGLVVLL